MTFQNNSFTVQDIQLKNYKQKNMKSYMDFERNSLPKINENGKITERKRLKDNKINGYLSFLKKQNTIKNTIKITNDMYANRLITRILNENRSAVHIPLNG